MIWYPEAERCCAGQYTEVPKCGISEQRFVFFRMSQKHVALRLKTSLELLFNNHVYENASSGNDKR